MQTQDTRSLPLQEKEFIRKRAVYSVINDKMKQKDVAKLYKVSTVSVCNWVKAYKKNGDVSLKNKHHGRPSETVSKLNKKQSSYIVKIIIDKTPDQLKFPFMLWTRQAVKQLIKKEFNIILSLPTISRYLKKWGFTPQRPIYRAIERDTKKVVKFLQEEYPLIKQRAKQEKAEIHWGDESGFRTDHTYGRSYSLKGKTPVVNKTGKRLKCNMMSTVANNGIMRFMVYEGSMDSKMFIKFLTKLIYKRDKKIFLILDNLRTHHSNKVKDWVEKRKDKIELFFLPPYSPELNPDELLNQDVKSNAYKHKLIHSTKELKQALHSYLRKIQKDCEKVKNFFKKEQVRFAS